jgi:hypothetical protein
MKRAHDRNAASHNTYLFSSLLASMSRRQTNTVVRRHADHSVGQAASDSPHRPTESGQICCVSSTDQHRLTGFRVENTGVVGCKAARPSYASPWPWLLASQARSYRHRRKLQPRLARLPSGKAGVALHRAEQETLVQANQRTNQTCPLGSRIGRDTMVCRRLFMDSIDHLSFALV